MYDVAQYRPGHDWTITPVGQLVTVDSRTKDNPITGRFCTGFNINSEGMFLTAGHCLTQGDTCGTLNTGSNTQNYAVVFNYEKGEERHYKYKINAVLESGPCVKNWSGDESVDYSVLQLHKSASENWGHINPILDLPAVNSGVIAVSHPRGQTKKIAFGQVQSVSDNVIDHTAYIEPGSSGSPLTAVVNKKNVALGVNVRVSINPFLNGADKTDHKHHYAIPISSIAESSRKVKQSSYSYSQSQGMFKKQRMDGDSISVSDVASEHNNYQNNDTGCCI